MSLQVAVHLAVLFPTLFRLVAIKFKSSLFMAQSDHAVTIPSCLFLPQPHLFWWQGTGPRQRPSRLSIDQDFNRLLSENLRTLQLPPRQQEIVCSLLLHFHDGHDGWTSWIWVDFEGGSIHSWFANHRLGRSKAGSTEAISQGLAWPFRERCCTGCNFPLQELEHANLEAHQNHCLRLSKYD